MSDDDRLVTVCAECLHRSRDADVKQLPVSELRRLGREHPDYWKASDDYPEPQEATR